MAVATQQLKPAEAQMFRTMQDLTVGIPFCVRRFGKTRLLVLTGLFIDFWTVSTPKGPVE